MIDVARRTGRVVQVGTQQRSGPHYQRARELIRKGHLGPVSRGPDDGLSQHHARLWQPARRHPPPEARLGHDGSARRLPRRITRTGRSITSAGSGIIPADR